MAIDKLLTNKQQEVLQSYLHDGWRIMILSGAVRAGKTFISDFIFLLELRRVARLAKERHDPHPIVILAGYSSNSIYTNVIASIENEFGLELKTDRHGHYHLFGVDIVPAYTGTARGIGAIRGATAYSAYIDEGSLADQSVFQEILQRCSVEGSRIIVTTNPGSPVHYLKTDYIDNQDPNARIKSFNFTIDDNTFLPSEYVKSLKAQTPSGMFYDRAILGLWVTGEGIVYQDFDKDTMVIPDEEIPDGLEHYVGIDWGFEHPNPVILLGDDPKTGITYVLRNYIKRHKFINYWVNIAHGLQDEFGKNLLFAADSARPDNITEFQASGINCINANKNVLAGIECVAQKMKEGKLRIAQSCANEIMKEIYQYAWDENTGMPMKENATRHNDSLDAIRYAIYTRNAKGGFTPWK